MAVDEDLEGAAAEYVVGTLDASERREVEARIAADPAFATMVADWAARLQPLADAAGEETPPGRVWTAILDAMHGGTAGAQVLKLERALRRWRLATAGVGLAAAVLAIAWLGEREVTPPAGESYVAILGGEGGKPAFVASVDTAARTIRLRRIGAPPPPDKSFELWQVPASGKAVSLGVADDVRDLRALNVALKPGELLAISLEPKGGSPTGQTTGPVIFTGSLLPAE